MEDVAQNIRHSVTFADVSGGTATAAAMASADECDYDAEGVAGSTTSAALIHLQKPEK